MSHLDKFQTVANLRKKLKEFIESSSLSNEIVSNVSSHLPEKTRVDFNENYHVIGTWCELLVYELALEFASMSSDVRFVVAKGIDVTKRVKNLFNNHHSDGLFYDSDARITIRGGDRSLGEYDLLLFNRFGDMVYCEVKKSAGHFSDRERYKILYKKRLLEDLFGCEVNLLFICGEKEYNNHEVTLLLDETGGDYVYLPLPSDSEIINSLSFERNRTQLNRKDAVTSKLAYWDQFETLKKLNYAVNHDQLRKFIISMIESKSPHNVMTWRIRSSLVERVFIGKVAKSDLDIFLKKVKICVNRNCLNPTTFSESFEGLIIALTIPRLNPIIYLKETVQNHYLNTEPNEGIFMYKGKYESPGSGFFKTITNTHKIIPHDLALNILNAVVKLDNYKVGE